jgi:glutamate-1-semialdehyde 2,1-aminomutase
MELENGYDILYQTGEKIVRAFNQASVQAKTSHLVTARIIFRGTMFELIFPQNLLKTNLFRDQLARYLADEGILLLQNHPSFICLDHERINIDNLTSRFFKGLCKWKENIEYIIK